MMTITEAHVQKEKWADLEKAFEELAKNAPAGVQEAFLVQSVDDPTLWRIIGHWRSRAEFEEMRRTTETPGAIRILLEVGAQPKLEMFDVAGHASWWHRRSEQKTAAV